LAQEENEHMKKPSKLMTITVLVMVAGAAFAAYRRAQFGTANREIGLKCLREGDDLLGLTLLVQFGKTEDVPVIIPLLDHANVHVRFSAAQTLQKLSGHAIPLPEGVAVNDHTFNLSDEAGVAGYISAWKDRAATYLKANNAMQRTRDKVEHDG
jgi:hypothetical protein